MRFSALGDMALLVPVLQKLQAQNPQWEIGLLSRAYLEPLFQPLKLSFFAAAELDGAHKGLVGLGRLARQLRREWRPDVVVDAHAVLRTQVLNQYFRLMGIPVHSLQKDRAGRKALTAYPDKRLEPLAHSTQLYTETFLCAGLQLDFAPQVDFRVHYASSPAVEQLWAQARGTLHLGIAPSAMHRSKEWPRAKMSRLLRDLPYPDMQLWFFGAPAEKEALQALGEASAKAFTVVAGRSLRLDEELALMQKLQAFIAMDSSNMHLASIAGLPVLSLWGATHPYAGFAPLGDNQRWMVQRSPAELDCRPCSAFGAKPCFRGDYACLEGLEEAQVARRLADMLAAHHLV